MNTNLKHHVWGTNVKTVKPANDKIVLARIWSHTQNIYQERNYPGLGQDKWECKKHVEEGREDKYCKTWLVKATTGGQGGKFQLFALSTNCNIRKRSLQKEFKEDTKAFWLPLCHKPNYTGIHVQG